MPDDPKMIVDAIKAAGGKVTEGPVALPDGSGFMTASFPLPKDHWLYTKGYNVPPMPFRLGTADPARHLWEEKLRAVARYAIRSATMNGKDNDFDPDAMVQNFIVGALGYHTPTGWSSDEWANPPEPASSTPRGPAATPETKEG